MRLYAITILNIFLSLASAGQTQTGIDKLLSGLSGQSENLIKDSTVNEIIAQGEQILSALSLRFTDTTISKVYSKCNNRYLKHGELAIILADRVETMPYFTLTGLQNCTFESCENNPNFVEYYLEFIRFRGMTKTFQKRYDEWLASDERKKYKL